MKVSAITLLLSSTSAITLKQLAEIRESTQACTLVAGSDPAVYKNNGVVCTPSGLAQASACTLVAGSDPAVYKNNGVVCTPALAQSCTLVAGSDPKVYKNNGVVCTPSGLAQSA